MITIDWQAIYDEQRHKDFVELCGNKMYKGLKLYSDFRLDPSRPNHPSFTKHWGV